MSEFDSDRYYDYQADRLAAESDAYVEWCEDNDLDPNDDNDAAWEAFKSESAEDAMIEAYERQQDAREEWAREDERE